MSARIHGKETINRRNIFYYVNRSTERSQEPAVKHSYAMKFSVGLKLFERGRMFSSVVLSRNAQALKDDRNSFRSPLLCESQL